MAEIVVDGQIALLEAAKKNSVRRLVLSDYADDLFKTPEREHPFYDMRRKADKAVQVSGLQFAKKRAADGDPLKWIRATFQLYMITDICRLDDLKTTDILTFT
ncbi:hypothetical protein BZG36_04687 [Bifiguratus adelaidae]|uniref:Uncharacterized protein n=1 Tax=Bifiguratus adelaidae TaxID=1938954 RepID=A0A261XUF5_9FUNG|nr:hypothetical protein BZG36_04687 [Bifiguratus adelaidae]